MDIELKKNTEQNRCMLHRRIVGAIDSGISEDQRLHLNRCTECREIVQEYNRLLDSITKLVPLAQPSDDQVDDFEAEVVAIFKDRKIYDSQSVILKFKRALLSSKVIFQDIKKVLLSKQIVWPFLLLSSFVVVIQLLINS